MTITIYHNPACGTSRKTLAAIREAGVEPVVVEYLKTPPTREKLVALIAAMGVAPRAVLRDKAAPYHELGLGEGAWSDDALIDAMVAHPVLINRPIVESPKGTALCRPYERVLALLPDAGPGAFEGLDGATAAAGADRHACG
ncbi:arsenate reductase (glutaredoxin) [Nitratireductor sp. StC3]|uniref:arsenate reductase (glutaredoxin) n=1 Tax=Nitratireductor sp. StC3 TaxID=2126741 RepID=UPI000D0DE981|nr:arsenate reductase (glutaredoxin) [Nitratireductor sp. StC3]PSM17669.1 arsenate reductase (glutaredoxin) [Nitratireductor sp. StC3]